MQSYYRETAKYLLENNDKKPLEKPSVGYLPESDLKEMYTLPEKVHSLESLEPSEIPSTRIDDSEIEEFGKVERTAKPLDDKLSDLIANQCIPFSGSDVKVIFDDKEFVEVTALYCHELSSKQASYIEGSNYYDRNNVYYNPVTIVIEYVLFKDSSFINYLRNTKDMDITLSFSDEYDNKSMRSITGANFIEDMSGISALDIMKGRIILSAKKAWPMESVK